MSKSRSVLDSSTLNPDDLELYLAARSPRVLYDDGYLADGHVVSLAVELGRDADAVRADLLRLGFPEDFRDIVPPRSKAPKVASGFYNMADLLEKLARGEEKVISGGSEGPKPEPLAKATEEIELKPVRKTEASQIVERAICDYVSLIGEIFTPSAVLESLRPLIKGIIRLTPLFPNAEAQERVKNAGCFLEKVIRSEQELNNADLYLIERTLFSDLYNMERLLDSLPEVHAPSKNTFGLRVTTASEVKPEFIEWLWKDRIPRGKLSLFTGNPDVGKSLVSLDVAARLSSGRDFPDGSPNTSGPCDVLMLAAEDDPADTIVPRLIAAGADLCRVHFLAGLSQEDRAFSLDSHTRLLREYLSEHSEIRCVVIDPISNYLGNLKLNSEQDVRQALTPLVRIAQQTNCAIVLVAHFNKQLGGDAIHKTGGAVGLVGIQRMAWAFAKSPDDENLRLMLRIKGNISPESRGLNYRITSKQITIQGKASAQPVIEWRGDTKETADNLLQTAADPEARSARQISAWLREFLSQGERPAQEIYDAAELKFGPCEDKLKRASKQLSVRKRQQDHRWYWSLPDNDLDNALPF